MIYKRIREFPLYVIDENYNVYRIAGKKLITPNGFIYRLKKQYISLDNNNLAIKTNVYLPVSVTELMLKFPDYEIYDNFTYKRVRFE